MTEQTAPTPPLPNAPSAPAAPVLPVAPDKTRAQSFRDLLPPPAQETTLTAYFLTDEQQEFSRIVKDYPELGRELIAFYESEQRGKQRLTHPDSLNQQPLTSKKNLANGIAAVLKNSPPEKVRKQTFWETLLLALGLGKLFGLKRAARNTDTGTGQAIEELKTVTKRLDKEIKALVALQNADRASTERYYDGIAQQTSQLTQQIEALEKQIKGRDSVLKPARDKENNPIQGILYHAEQAKIAAEQQLKIENARDGTVHRAVTEAQSAYRAVKTAIDTANDEIKKAKHSLIDFKTLGSGLLADTHTQQAAQAVATAEKQLEVVIKKAEEAKRAAIAAVKKGEEPKRAEAAAAGQNRAQLTNAEGAKAGLFAAPRRRLGEAPEKTNPFAFPPTAPSTTAAGGKK